jgi:hypothetical protein
MTEMQISDAEYFPQDNDTGVEPEDTSGSDKITEPFNPALIRVDTRPMTIDLLLSRIEHKELDLQPSFQGWHLE